jgi:hypothetical protein
MKTNKFLKIGFFLIAAAVISLAGCSKEKQKDDSPDTSTLQQLSKDDIIVENASDEAMNDVNTLLSGGNFFKSANFWPCNATIDSTSVVNDTITFYITYNGLSCNGKWNRTGKIEIKKKVGIHWNDQGATVIVTCINFHITREATGKSIMLNGTKTFQNVTGGFLWQLGYQYSSIVHKSWGTLEVTFDNDSTRSWNVARQRTYTGTFGQLVMTVDGFGSEGSYNNLVVWGINRNGENFYTQITQSVVFRETCSWNPCSGIKVHQIPADSKKATITFGYNDHNDPVVGDECPTKYRLDWEKGTHSGTIYLWL